MTEAAKYILLVDEESSLRAILKTALESWGYRVRIAVSGAEALAAFKAMPPIAVLSAMVAPKEGGLALLRALKKWDPHAVVILFTAYPSLGDAVSAIREGAADLLTRPIDFRRLRKQLERFLDGDGASSGGSFPESVPTDPGLCPPESIPSTRDERPQAVPHDAGKSH